jgi:2-C-methyl-D-erythritol 4-phosphate cytidylyltransferase
MGKRMGASINKQYLQLSGRPIVARTLQVLQDSPAINGIILIIPEDEIPYCRSEVVEKYHFSKVLTIVAGGAERQHSVMNGLAALQHHAADTDIVLIHDGVRPFITEAILQQYHYHGCHRCGSIGCGTSQRHHQGSAGWYRYRYTGTCHPLASPDSTGLPLSARSCRAIPELQLEKFLGTDDCSLFERYKETVKIISRQLPQYQNNHT